MCFFSRGDWQSHEECLEVGANCPPPVQSVPAVSSLIPDVNQTFLKEDDMTSNEKVPSEDIVSVNVVQAGSSSVSMRDPYFLFNCSALVLNSSCPDSFKRMCWINPKRTRVKFFNASASTLKMALYCTVVSFTGTRVKTICRG